MVSWRHLNVTLHVHCLAFSHLQNLSSIFFYNLLRCKSCNDVNSSSFTTTTCLTDATNWTTDCVKVPWRDANCRHAVGWCARYLITTFDNLRVHSVPGWDESKRMHVSKLCALHETRPSERSFESIWSNERTSADVSVNTEGKISEPIILQCWIHLYDERNRAYKYNYIL